MEDTLTSDHTHFCVHLLILAQRLTHERSREREAGRGRQHAKATAVEREAGVGGRLETVDEGRARR
eukprot:scaffold306564_cov28-Tisochrysis_lutea.AAC.1